MALENLGSGKKEGDAKSPAGELDDIRERRHRLEIEARLQHEMTGGESDRDPNNDIRRRLREVTSEEIKATERARESASSLSTASAHDLQHVPATTPGPLSSITKPIVAGGRAVGNAFMFLIVSMVRFGAWSKEMLDKFGYMVKSLSSGLSFKRGSGGSHKPLAKRRAPDHGGDGHPH